MRKKSILFLITCTMLFLITSISYAEVNQSDVKKNIENYENNTENKEVKDDENVDLNNEQNDIEEKNATKQEDENIINKDNVEEKDNVVNEIEKKDTNINGLVLENGIYFYYENGVKNTNYTGLYVQDNIKWYVIGGKVDFSYTGKYTDSENIYYIENNKVSNDTKLVYLDDWRMVVDGKIVYDYTGIGKNGNGYWYLEKGNISYTYNGEYNDGEKTYLIKENRVYGIIEKNTTCLMEINGIWRMVVDGKIIYDYTGIGKNGNGYWYLEKGNISYTYNGIYNDGVDDYVIENSRVVGTKLMEINGTWRMVVDGKIVYDYTGIGKNGNGYWYLEKGEISYKYNGTWYDENENAFIIENNRVQAIVKKDTTGLIVIDKEWRMVKNGVVDYNYTGIGEKNNEKWYLENGKITYTYNGEYKEEDGIVYNVINSLVSGIISRPGFESTMVVEQPERLNKYISDSLIVSGWALSSNKNDKILIYVDGIYCGEASRRNRDDILEKYINGEYGGNECNLQPGFYFDLSIKRLSVGTHIVTIVNIADDGETIIQSRDVLINITALTKSWGIDVSEHQGKINWEAVKNSGVTFAILRVGYYLESSGRTVIDKYFYENYEACKRLGIAVGGYFYSYAFNGTEGEHEANSCLSVIKGKVFELPVFIDVEDRIIKNAVADGRTTVENVTNASVSFCEKLINAGYQAGVYASRNFFYDYFNIPLIEKYSIWVAHYTDNQTDYNRKYDFWQSSSNGSVPGINGRVDMDWFYQK